ncbi:FeoB-associated Cys-rich membrane protein [Psychroflexus sp. YR1-1]|uniref:FeoB-associated Cys-rich membrane protein n=1 Tax=Psychroflexus aurantiacus TaxID=2709310 RepID=A0A6B3QZR6_9FLAO|nr:FeoB-associated Cys-rich membrane protein [Psychroflexus aurantiacus]NEV92560.1 FeoB-associated Cys-rich membrane protein [Psychroflexus aurantiacus]
MMLQELLVLFIFLIASGYLIKKFFFKSRSGSSSCGSGQCGCKD